MENIKERLEFYLKSKRINKSEFGRRIGVSNAFISSMKKSISPEKLQKISEEFPDLSIDWLMTGQGKMIKNTGDSIITVDSKSNNINSNQSINKLIDEISAQRKMTEAAQNQIDRMLSIIEDLTTKIK